MKSKNLLSLNFQPLFWTQCFNALNDNIFKSSLVLIITYKSYQIFGWDSKSIIALVGILFNLPFFLFSAFAGALADHKPKSSLISKIKFFEFIILLIAFLAFGKSNIETLIILTFFLATQSAFLGPVKLGILPELIDREKVYNANAFFSMGTFISILLGTALGGILVKSFPHSYTPIAIILIVISLIAFILSLFIPRIKPIELKKNKYEFNPLKGIKKGLSLIAKFPDIKKAIYLSLWTWFAGSYFLIIIPHYVKNSLNSDESVSTLFMAAMSISMAIGSLLSSRLKKLRIKKVLIISVIIMIISLLIMILISIFQNQAREELLGIKSFFLIPFNFFAFINFNIFAIGAGIFSVPLQTYVQINSSQNNRSQIIAAMNILQALAMSLSSIFLLFSAKFALSFQANILILLALLMLILAYLMKEYPKLKELT